MTVTALSIETTDDHSRHSLVDFDAAEVWGEYERIVDQKGRVVIPPPFRPLLAEGFVITRLAVGRLALVPISEWRSLDLRIRNHPAGTAPMDCVALVAGRDRACLDTNGRVRVPKPTREWAHIAVEAPVVILAVGRRVEIWNKPLLYAHFDEVSQSLLSDSGNDGLF